MHILGPRLRQVACIVIGICMLAACTLAEVAPIRLILDTEALDLAYIRDGALVTNFNEANDKGIVARYTGVELGEDVRKVSCRARFEGGGAVAIVAMPADEWSVAGITRRSIHAVFTSTGYHFGFFEDGVLTDVLADEYTLDVTGEKEYTFGFSIDKTTITFQLPTGKKVKKRDDRVKACNGPYVLFEHYLTAEDVAAGYAPVITHVEAKGAKLPALADDFQRGDGLPVMAPSGHAYVQFRND